MLPQMYQQAPQPMMSMQQMQQPQFQQQIIPVQQQQYAPIPQQYTQQQGLLATPQGLPVIPPTQVLILLH